MVQYQCSCTYFSHAAPSYIISPQLRMCVHLYARVIWCAVHTADFIDFHRDMTQAPLYLFTSYLKFGPLSHTCTHTYIHAYIHTCTTPLLPPPRPPDSPSWNIPLMGFVLWGYGRVSSHKWISPHIPLSIKEPVCAPTATRRTPLQLFVLSDTSTCSLYTCVVCAPATCISCTQQWDSFLPYCISHVLLFMCASHCFTSFSHQGCWIC